MLYQLLNHVSHMEGHYYSVCRKNWLGGVSITLNPDTETSILALEQAILEVGSNLNVAQGVFYMLPVYSNGKLFVRYVKKIQISNPQANNISF